MTLVWVGAMIFSPTLARAYDTTPYFYRVKERDSISEILYRFGVKSIYGKKGFLRETLVLNAAKHRSSGDEIFPGEILYLPRAVSARYPGIKEILPSGEVISREAARPVDQTPALAQDSPSVSREIASQVPHSEDVTPAETPAREVPARAALALEPSFRMTTLSGKDPQTGGQATVASKLHFRLDTKYFQEWTEKFRSYVGIQFGYVQFEKPTDSRKSITSASKMTSGISLAVQIDFSPRTSVEGDFAYGKALFLRPLSTTSVTVDAVSVPSVGVKLSHDLLNLRPFTLGVRGVSSVTLPTKSEGYATRLGASYGGILYLKQDLAGANHNERYETSLGLTQRRQNTSILNQTETEVVLSVRIILGGSLK